MTDKPIGKRVYCPECSEAVIALVPKNSKIVNREEAATGKVWASCRNCGEEFLVHYQR